MNRNVKIAKELVKLAKSLVVASDVNLHRVFKADGMTLRLNHEDTAKFIFSKSDGDSCVMSCEKIVFDCAKRSEEESAEWLKTCAHGIFGILFGLDTDYIRRKMTFGSIGHERGKVIVSDFKLTLYDVYKAGDIYEDLKLYDFKVDDSFAEKD